jgi:hypothetical protein
MRVAAAQPLPFLPADNSEAIVTLTRKLTLAAAAAVLLAGPLIPDTAYAQRRGGAVRVAPRSGAVRLAPRRGVVVAGAYYRPLFYDPFFYDPFWYPYAYPSRYGWYPPYAYGYGGGFYDDSASVRLQVTPRETEVFVDGYYAGTADSFDGMFQRLNLAPGEHDVTLYLEGHRSVTQKILLQPRGDFRVKHTMVALGAGDTPDPRPLVQPRPARQRQGQPGTSGTGPERQPEANFGAIAIRVQPGDAEVLIDGERWEGPASDEALVVQIVPGAHRIEVRKDGYRRYTGQVDVSAGQTAPLNISLPRQ